MKTNLIQSYMTNLTTQQYNSDKTKQSFDVNKELARRTFIKPLPSNGQLVRNTIFDVPGEFFRDIKYDLKAFRHSVNGKANDHELGRLNDLGMKTGGLAIASYLFSQRGTPLTRIMEFVGVTAFFAAMDIWPKLALQLPAYLIHGFDIRQNYKDNFGTKKPVFLDHQFIPWDLYSDKEINEIGNRMGVPKDMKNRRDFIQEKMRKIALQNNTMWMLTSGFATPIMSALICNSLEKPINRYQNAQQNSQAQALLNNFTAEANKYNFAANEAKLEKVLGQCEGKPITEDVLKKIVSVLSDGFDVNVKNAVYKDLKEILKTDGYDFSTDTFKSLQTMLKEKYSAANLSPEQLEKIIPDDKELAQSFSSLLGSGKEKNVTNFSEHVKAILNLMDNKINRFAQTCNNRDLIEDLRFITDSLLESENISKNPVLSEIFTQKPSTVFSAVHTTLIKNVSKILNDLKARNAVLNKYAYIKAAQAPETILANSWNVSENLLKIFNFSNEEISKVRYDREFVGQLLRSKLEKIVSNEELYAKVVSELRNQLSSLERNTAFGSFDKFDQNSDNLYKKYVDVTFNEAADKLSHANMPDTARRLNGYYQGDTRSMRDIQLSFIQDRVRGVRSSFYRILNMLDMFHRIATCENLPKKIFKDMPRVTREEVIEMCKQLLISGHSSDYSVKFNYPIDMDLNPKLTPEQAREFYSDIEVKDGKVVNKFAGKKALSELADNSYDKNFYEVAMRLMYGEEPHPHTIDKIKETSFYSDFIKYRQNLLNAFGSEKYFAKPFHIIEGTGGSFTNEFKFLILGCAPDELFEKLCSQRYNGNKWLKVFGGSAAALLGVTTLSQFFMGKMNSDKIKEIK